MEVGEEGLEADAVVVDMEVEEEEEDTVKVEVMAVEATVEAVGDVMAEEAADMVEVEGDQAGTAVMEEMAEKAVTGNDLFCSVIQRCSCLIVTLC